MTSASSRAHDISRLFVLCERIEAAHAGMYRTLAEIHRTYPTISALWRKTAQDEERHAAQFRLAAAGYASAVTSVSIDLAQVTKLLQSVEETALRIRQQSLTVPEALQLAISMEEVLANLHLDQVAEFSEPRVKRLFSAMMSADGKHVQALRDALQVWEEPDEPKEQLA